MRHAAAGGDRQVVASGALEGVRQRQEGQEQVVGLRRHALECGFDVFQHVVVAQHHALGHSRRARCVDQRGQRVGRGRQTGLHKLGGRLALRQPVSQQGHRHACRSDRAARRLIDDDYLAQRRQRNAGGGNGLPLRVGESQQHRGITVGQDVGDAGRIVDGMQRHRHTGQGQRGLVDADRIKAVGQHDRDAGAARQRKTFKRHAKARYPRAGALPGNAGPAAARRVVLQIGVGQRRLRNAPGKQFGQSANARQLWCKAAVGGRRIYEGLRDV